MTLNLFGLDVYIGQPFAVGLAPSLFCLVKDHDGYIRMSLLNRIGIGLGKNH